MSFLIVDRNRRFAEFMQEILYKAFPESDILIAGGLSEAYNIIRYNPINVLICDGQNEDDQIFRQFSELKYQNPGLQIILTTNFSNYELIASCICHGALECFVKPISPRILEDLINYAFKTINIVNKKFLLLQDIIMLSKGGQMFTPAMIKSLILTLEQRNSAMNGYSMKALEVLKKISLKEKFSSQESILLELAVEFYGITFDPRKTNLLLGDLQNKETSKFPINGEVINKMLITIKNSYKWFKLDSRGRSDEIPFCSRLLAAIIAYTSMSNKHYLSGSFDEKTVIKTLKKYSGTRFDPRAIDLISNI